jgi:hypothetical protein
MADSVALSSKEILSSSVTETVWFNALWFQSIWFCAVLGRETLLPLTLVLLILHLFLVRNTQQELRQLVPVALVGIGTDACLSYIGLFQFEGNVLVPLWLCCLWLAFAGALPRSLSYLGQRRLLAALAGGVVFPLNYWAGQRLGAVDFTYSLPVTLGSMALIWAVLLPGLYQLTALLQKSSRQ